MENNNVIYGINGPVVTVKNTDSFEMMEMVHVGKQKLVGEIIGITDDITTIQVYEETTGLKPGDPVEGTGAPMNVLLGPGIIDNIFDGIERPLKAIEEEAGAFINRGSSVSALDDKKLWNVTMKVKVGDKLEGGQIYATLPETPIIEHRLMVPPELSGEVVKVNPNGEYKLFDTVVVIKDDEGVEHNLTLCQQWPIRTSRPVKERLTSSVPLITGQRVIDTLFPIAKGGTAAIPGGFGTGKTMTQHQLAKWCDADIIIYVGCGERGNEMTDVLNEFPELKDPRTGNSLMERTVLIANTSDMPVAAREASIYTGITIAEYFRDMGYTVALMADSTSRWAEALREMSGRLEEMPGEEGYPAYLGSRLAQFYERAGRVIVNGSDDTEGALSVIGAVSPPGGDISEPVSQATLRIVKVFWGLDANLAYKRHFPAINWLTSYSLYTDRLADWFSKNAAPDFMELRGKLMTLLQEESELQEIVNLVGMDALSAPDRLKLETSRSIREDYLHQNAFDPTDTYTSLGKQVLMMRAILAYYDKAKEALANGADIEMLVNLPVRERIGRYKYVPEDKVRDEFESIKALLDSEIKDVLERSED
mgnify:CR=1 FL=1